MPNKNKMNLCSRMLRQILALALEDWPTVKMWIEERKCVETSQFDCVSVYITHRPPNRAKTPRGKKTNSIIIVCVCNMKASTCVSMTMTKWFDSENNHCHDWFCIGRPCYIYIYIGSCQNLLSLIPLWCLFIMPKENNGLHPNKRLMFIAAFGKCWRFT